MGVVDECICGCPVACVLSNFVDLVLSVIVFSVFVIRCLIGDFSVLRYGMSLSLCVTDSVCITVRG